MADWYRERKARWRLLSPGERRYIVWHPWHAGDIERATEKALREAHRRFGQGSLHNGAGDAFRHCFWAALLSRDIGPGNALSFTRAHEEVPENPRQEKEMDLHNNGIGAAIGAASPHGSDAMLGMICFEALVAGRLKILEPGARE